MRLIYSAFLVTICLQFLNAQEVEMNIEEKLIGLDEEIKETLKIWDVPGAAVGIINRDKIVYNNSFGYRNIEENKPVTSETLFAIGSCTKAFTASLLGILENEKQIEFEKSPRSYIPELNFYNQEMNRSISIRDMMNHTTGLARHDFSWILFPVDSNQNLISRFPLLEPLYTVKNRFKYNNLMYELQGTLVEKVTNESWSKNIREKLFKPLEMKDSKLSVNELDNTENLASGYNWIDNKWLKVNSFDDFTHPSGSIYSNITEMSNWVIPWLNQGKYNNKQVIPESFVNKAITIQTLINSNVPNDENEINISGYGYGWEVSIEKGNYIVYHQGGASGFSSVVCLLPNYNMGFVVLTNTQDTFPIFTLLNKLIDRLLQLESKDWNKHYLKIKKEQTKTKSETSNKKSNEIIPDVQQYIGVYNNSGYGKIEITESNGELFAQFPDYKFKLNYRDTNTFEFVEYGNDTQNIISFIKASGIPNVINFDSNTNSSKMNCLSINLEPELSDSITFSKVEVLD